MRKIIIFSSSLLIILVGFLTFSYFNTSPQHTTNSPLASSSSIDYENLPDLFQVDILNIGKADCILIQVGQKTVMIDTGEDEEATTILSFLKEKNISTLDYLILTHFDKDHIGGAATLLQSLNILEVIQPNYKGSGKPYKHYLKALKKANLSPLTLTEPLTLTLEGSDWFIDPPKALAYSESDNDFSLVTSVTYQDTRFLFAGDAEAERLNELLTQTTFDLKHDFLKVPHHGTLEKNSQVFLEKVNPQYAVITCSNEEPASPHYLKLLEQLKIAYFLTTNGNFHCISTGKEIISW